MRRLALMLCSLSAIGCGAELDRPYEIDTLRILGVQKSAPYAEPGETVELTMLWHDGSTKAPRPVEIAWFAGCFNPPGDLYYNCFETFQGFDGSGGLPPGTTLGTGDRFSFTMPDDIIDSRPPPSDPNQPPYGLSYVFFAICGGQFGPAPQASSGDQFPIGCYDGAGEPLGSADFIVGYAGIYAYRGFRNNNPIISGFTFNDVTVPSVCIGDTCPDAVAAPLDCSQPDAPCIFGCEEDGEDSCPAYPIAPIVDRASAEQDEVSEVAYGTSAREQMWIRYFSDRGTIESDVRLLNDATKGWNDDYGTEFRAPRDPGVVNLWAVVYDNRGGVNWVRTQVLVQ